MSLLLLSPTSADSRERSEEPFFIAEGPRLLELLVDLDCDPLDPLLLLDAPLLDPLLDPLDPLEEDFDPTDLDLERDPDLPGPDSDALLDSDSDSLGLASDRG